MKTDFQRALIDSYDTMIERYDRLTEISVPHRFSESFRLRMEQVLREHGGSGQSPVPAVAGQGGTAYAPGRVVLPNGKQHRLRRVLLVAALIAVLLISSVAVLAVVYPEYFMSIKDKVKEWEIGFVREQGAESEEDAPFIVRKIHVPVGFEITEEHEEATSYDAVYQDAADPPHTIIYTQERVNEATVVGLDAENDRTEHITLDGREVLLSKDGDTYTLFWTEGNCAYTLIGDVEPDALKIYSLTK